MSLQSTISTIIDLIQHWQDMGDAIDPKELQRIRREIAAHYFYLTTQSKPLFIARSASYITRKRNMAGAIMEAMYTKRGMSKAEAEASVEALAKTHADKLIEIEAEAEVDALRGQIQAINQVLNAMAGELRDYGDIAKRENYIDNLNENREQ